MKKIIFKTLFWSSLLLGGLLVNRPLYAQHLNVEAAGFMNHQNFNKGIASGGYSAGISFSPYFGKSRQWSLSLGVLLSRSYFKYVGHPLNGSFSAVDIDGAPFTFQYKLNFYLENETWNSIRVPLAVQFETKGKTSWYVRTGVVFDLKLGKGTEQSTIGNLQTTGYYPQWDAVLSNPKYAGFGQFNYLKRKRDIKFENTFAWLLETGVKWHLHGSRRCIYLGAFVNVGLNDIRPKDVTYGRLMEYTANVDLPLDYRNIWHREDLKDKKMQDYMIGIKLRYGFGGK